MAGKRKNAKDAFVAANSNSNDLKFVPVNEDGTIKNPNDQTGWQKINDTKVQERTFEEISHGKYLFNVSVYDFSNYTFEAWKIGLDAEDSPTFLGRQPFSELQGVRGIETAHKALTELKGQPGPLHTALGLDSAGNPAEPQELRAGQLNDLQKVVVPQQQRPLGFRASWMK